MFQMVELRFIPECSVVRSIVPVKKREGVIWAPYLGEIHCPQEGRTLFVVSVLTAANVHPAGYPTDRDALCQEADANL
jgi:hypothetical protein